MRHGFGRAVGAGLAAAFAVEGVGLLVDAGREKPLLWHDLLTERKYHQMCHLALRGGADVVSIGCSHSVLGIDATLVGEQLDLRRPAFNAALYRAMPSLASHWLERVVLPLLRPRYVLWGLTPFHLNDNGILHREITEKYLAGAAHRRPRPVRWPVEVVRRTFLARLPYALGAGRRKDTLRSFLKALGDLGSGRLSLLTIPGELGRNGLGQKTEHFSYLNTERLRYVLEVETAGDYEIRGEQLAKIEAGVEAARAAGARVIFVRMPLADDATSGFPRGRADLDDGDAAIRALADRLDVPLVDIADRFTDERWFADFVHLNGVGRRAFSLALGEAIRTRVLHTGEPETRVAAEESDAHEAAVV